MITEPVWQGPLAVAHRVARAERALASLEKLVVYEGVDWASSETYASLYAEIVRLDPRFPIRRWMRAARARRQERIEGGMG